MEVSLVGLNIDGWGNVLAPGVAVAVETGRCASDGGCGANRPCAARTPKVASTPINGVTSRIRTMLKTRRATKPARDLTLTLGFAITGSDSFALAST